MDESVVRVFEEQKVGTLRLSEAIRIGCGMIPNGRLFLNNGCGCALGAAAVATGLTKWPTGDEGSFFDHLVSATGAPRDLLWEISTTHYAGLMTREQCADYAASKGY